MGTSIKNDFTEQYEIDEDASSSIELDYVNDNPVIEVDDNGMPVCPPPVSNSIES